MAEGLSGAYLAGRQAASDKDFKRAAEYLTRALTRDSANPQLMEAAIQAQLSLGRVDRAVPIARKLDADGLRSQAGHMALVLDLIDRSDHEGLLGRLDEDRGIGALVDGLLVGWAFLGSGSVREALEAFDNLAAERGLSGFALYHKALALASVGDFEGAEALFADESAAPLQMTRRGVIARLAVLSQLDRAPDAVALIDESFGPDLDPALRDLRARLSAGERLTFQIARDSREGMAEVFHTVAAVLTSEADDEYTLLFTQAARFLRPDHVDATLATAELLEELGQFDLAVETFATVPADAPSFHAAELGRAEALRRSERLDEAAEVLDRLTRSHGDLPVVHVTTGDLKRQLKRYDQAVDSYTRALELFSETRPEHWFIYYARAISYERQGIWPEAEADFRKALELNPDQPQVLNYLGYSLVEKKMKLDEALDMIERAVAGRPDSGYIVDSLGWVLYRLGRYDEAVVQMERATELEPVDPVINDHLGDVYWAVGRYREAEFQWRRALSFIGTAPSSEDADPDRIRRKLEVGLDVVLEEEGAPPLRRVDGN